MTPRVLVLGGPDGLCGALELLLMGRAQVGRADAADDTEGIGVDVVVAAGREALEHVKDVRVHPRLHRAPAVVLAVPVEEAPAVLGTWFVDPRRAEMLDDLTERVSWLLARAHHPTSRRTFSPVTPAA
jgi:hypothetical protein